MMQFRSYVTQAPALFVACSCFCTMVYGPENKLNPTYNSIFNTNNAHRGWRKNVGACVTKDLQLRVSLGETGIIATCIETLGVWVVEESRRRPLPLVTARHSVCGELEDGLGRLKDELHRRV